MKRTRRRYPCICHPQRPHVATGLCRACWTFLATAKRNNMGGKRAERLKKIVDKHDERKSIVATQWAREDKIRRTRSPDAYRRGRNKSLKDRYGITLEEYNKKLKLQGGVCAICRKPNKYKKPFYVDHCHTTGKIRGLLCPGCNTLVGFLETLGGLIKEANLYLKQHI